MVGGGHHPMPTAATHTSAPERNERAWKKAGRAESLDLLLGAQLAGAAALVLARQLGHGGVNDTAAQAQHQVQRRLLLDVVVRQRAAVLQLLAGKDQALLVGRDALLVLDLLLHILDGVAALPLQRDGLARQRLHKDLHGSLPDVASK